MPQNTSKSHSRRFKFCLTLLEDEDLIFDNHSFQRKIFLQKMRGFISAVQRTLEQISAVGVFIYQLLCCLLEIHYGETCILHTFYEFRQIVYECSHLNDLFGHLFWDFGVQCIVFELFFCYLWCTHAIKKCLHWQFYTSQ